MATARAWIHDGPPGERLDRIVADATGCGRRRAREWIGLGLVLVDGRTARAAEIPERGATIAVEEPPRGSVAPSTCQPRVLFEDDRVVLLCKPAGLHCERGRSAGCVADFLEAKDPTAASIGDREAEAGLVHRIDRDTSGLVLAAKTRDGWLALRAAFSRGRARKSYLALVSGDVAGELRIELPLARRRGRVAPAGPRDAALEATTTVRPLERGAGWTLVLASMRTGVTHQVRAHLAAAGHPLLGDTDYAGPRLDGSIREGQLLHALRLVVEEEGLDFTVPATGDFVHDLGLLRRGARPRA